jgi:hypothetical protein
VKGNLYMIGLYGVTVSYDQGGTWYKLTPTVDDPYESSSVTSMDSMIASSINDFSDARSKNSGYARSESITNFTTQRVTSLAVNSAGHIYAGTQFGGVYRTTNSGGSWQQVPSGLTNNAVYSLNMTPGDTLYAGSSGIVYRSSHPTVDIKELAGYNPNGTFVEVIYPNISRRSSRLSYLTSKGRRLCGLSMR